MQALPAAAWHKACSSIKELPPRPLRQPAAGGDGEKPRAARKSGRNSPFGSGGGSTLQRQEQGGKARGAAGGPRAVGQGKGSAEPSRTGLRARRVLTPERARASCASASVRCVRKPGEGGEGGCVQLGKPLAFLKHFFFFLREYIKEKGGKGTEFLRSSSPRRPPPSALPTAVVVIIMIAAKGRGRGGSARRGPLLTPQQQPGAAGAGPALRCQRCRSPVAARGLRRETWRETPGRRDPAPRTHPHTQRDSIPHRLLSEHLVQPQPMEIYAGHNREQDFVPSLPPPSPLFSLSLPPSFSY